jgi:D-3-phosphoglycerate dehydrogenase / 2-oxoglutarate reductase
MLSSIMAHPIIALTLPIAPVGEQILREAGCELRHAADQTPASLLAVCADADAVIVRALLPADLIDRSPRLLGAMRHGVGVDLIPVDRANALGVCVGFVPGVNANSVAEFVIGQMLASARNIQRMDRVLRVEGWQAARPLSDAATELRGKTLGIVGVGAIGARLAEIARLGFRMTVLGHRRDRAQLPAGVDYAELVQVFERSDYIALACPLTAQTRGLASASMIARMKPTAWLLNVSRGAVVDEPALVEALRGKRIGGAVLDVFATQPLAPEHPLRELPNAILTPHVAGLSIESARTTSEIVATDTLHVLRGEPPVHLYNREIWPAFLERRRTLGWPERGLRQ